MVRFKNRYLLVQTHSNEPKSNKRKRATTLAATEDEEAPSKPLHAQNWTEKKIFKKLKDDIQMLFGDLGAAQTSGLNVKYFNPITGLAIIRCSRDSCKMVATALTLINDVDGVKCEFELLHTSGTIRHCQLKAIEYNRKIIDALELIMDETKEEDKIMKIE